ncbi:hypothetical protein PHET_06067 [Paragonimus heterotremus]|uniref:Phorbol-ester/DAG-type domain-containing protein n=1 Tax=Paragonimus heterotremus TaxID=100268 RepID=A0A8J4SY51_9TREM|nr:hypothetical protein PHET_06067 [Paragonimus heterotremus]
MWSGAHTLPKYRYHDPDSSSIPIHLQTDKLAPQTATSQLVYAQRKESFPHSYSIFSSSNVVEKSKLCVMPSSTAQCQLLDTKVPRLYHSTQHSGNTQLMKQHYEVCDDTEDSSLLTPYRSLQNSLGLSPSGSPMVSKSNDLRDASQPPKCYSSKRLVEFPRGGIPSTALVRTIVRIHGSRAPSSRNEKPITKESPPELPVRKRSHGARRVTQSVYHYTPVFKPDTVLLDQIPDIPVSRLHSDPSCTSYGSLPGPRTFNLEGHLDCSCDYVCGDAGLWPADVWYQRNFHTVDRCTCPHEEIHRFFDKAASSWRLAETIAMLPIKETDILDNLVDSTSDEEDLQTNDQFSGIPKLNSPQHKPEESKPRFEAPLPNKEHLHLVREKDSNHACIPLPNEHQTGFQRRKSASQENDAEKSTRILQSCEDDFVTLGELLSENELFPPYTKYLPPKTFVPDKSDASLESQNLSPLPLDSKQLHSDKKSIVGYARNAVVSTAPPVTGSSTLSQDNNTPDNKGTVVISCENRQAVETSLSSDLYEKDSKNVMPKNISPLVPTKVGIEESITGGKPNINSTRKMIQIQKVDEGKSVTASWMFGDAIEEANEKAQDLSQEGTSTMELHSIISPSVSTERIPEVVEDDINEAESDVDLNEWLAESSDSIMSEQEKKETVVTNHEDLEFKHQPVPFRPQKTDVRLAVSKNLRNSSLYPAHFKNSGQGAVAQASYFKSNENKLKKDVRTIREQFDARQRALKRWALLSVHVSEMSDRRRKERDTTAALGFYKSIEITPEKTVWGKRGLPMVSDLTMAQKRTLTALPARLTNWSSLTDQELKLHVYRKTLQALAYPISSNTPHNFQPFNATSPTYCYECEGLLWGVARQGLRCTECGVKCHDKCKRLLNADCLQRAAEKSLRHGAVDKAQAAMGAIKALIQRRLTERPDLFIFVAAVFQTDIQSAQHLSALESVEKSILAGASQRLAKIAITGELLKSLRLW